MKTLRLAVLAMALCYAPAVLAQTAPADEAHVDRMTDSMVQLLPLGQVFEMFASQDPSWPMQARPDAVTPGQLSCLRTELSREGFRRAKRRQVAEYAAAHPERMQDEVRLLEEGAAEVLGRLVNAGVNDMATGQAPDVDAVIKGATEQQMAAATRFVEDPALAPLRELSGIGEVFNTNLPPDEQAAAGERLGANVARRFMLAATRTCQVPPEAYL